MLSPTTSVKLTLYHFSAWIQAFASVINVNAACKADYTHLRASIIAVYSLVHCCTIEYRGGTLLCILDFQG